MPDVMGQLKKTFGKARWPYNKMVQMKKNMAKDSAKKGLKKGLKSGAGAGAIVGKKLQKKMAQDEAMKTEERNNKMRKSFAKKAKK